MRRLALAAAALAAWLPCKTARADGHDSELSVVSVEGVTGGREVPLTEYGDQIPGRYVGLKSGNQWPVTIGFGVDGELHAGWLVWRYAGLHFASSLGGQSGSGVTGEAPVTIENGPLDVVEMDIPLLGGIGVDAFVGRWLKAGVLASWGWAYAWSPATYLASGGVVAQGVMHDDSVYLSASADACVRLGKPPSSGTTTFVSWACLTGSVDLYAFGSGFDGGTLGLKVEL